MDEPQQNLHSINTEIAHVIQAALRIDLADAEAVATHAARVHEIHDTLTILLDPAAWRRDRQAIQAADDVLQAFLTFRRVLEQARAK